MIPVLKDLCGIDPPLDVNVLMGTTGFTNPSVIMREPQGELHLVLKRNQYDRQKIWLTNDLNWDAIFDSNGKFGVEHVYLRLSRSFDVIESRPIRFPAMALGTQRFDAADDVRLIEWNGRLHMLGSCIAMASRFEGGRWRVNGTLIRMFLAPVIDGEAVRVDVLPALFQNADFDKNWVARERSTGKLQLGIDFNRNLWIAIADADVGRMSIPQHGLEWQGGWSGTSNLVNLKGREFFGVVHRAVSLRPSKYIHMFVICDENLKVLRRSVPFTFEGKMIEFCLGVTKDAKRNELIISYGVWDREAMIFRLPVDVAAGLCGIALDDPRELYQVK